MKKYILLSAGILLSGWLTAQDTTSVSLEWCLQQARSTHPLQGQFELIGQSSELKIKNLNKNYLPDLSLNGQASYQSDVTKVPVRIPESPFQIEPIDKDWYKLTLDMNQVIYDGGATGKSKSIEQIETEIRMQEVETDLYQVNESVLTVYFTILTINDNLVILQTHEDLLKARLKEVRSAVDAGAVLESNAEILQAELLKLKQQKKELEVKREYSYRILSELISTELPGSVTLERPSTITALPQAGYKRPEYALFESQQRKLDATKKMAGVNEIPKLMAFGQLGYGRPGYDMLNNKFDDFYMVGLRLQWDIWNWGKVRNEKEILDINREIIGNRREAFTKGLTVEQQQKLSEIEKYRELLKDDEQIVTLREKVAATAASQLRNGTITSTEYLAEQNAATQAQLMLQLHRLQHLKAQYDYLLTIGEL